MKMKRNLTPMEAFVWRNVRARYPGFTEKVSDLYWDLLEGSARIKIGDAKLAKRLLVELPDGIDIRDIATDGTASEAVLSTDKERISSWAVDVLKCHEAVETVLDNSSSLLSFEGGGGWLLLDRTAEMQQDISRLEGENEYLRSHISDIDKKINNIGSNEMNSMYTLIYGALVKKYDFDNEDQKNDATGKIHSILLNMGVSLHQDTIRKILRDSIARARKKTRV